MDYLSSFNWKHCTEKTAQSILLVFTWHAFGRVVRVFHASGL